MTGREVIRREKVKELYRPRGDPVLLPASWGLSLLNSLDKGACTGHTRGFPMPVSVALEPLVVIYLFKSVVPNLPAYWKKRLPGPKL